MTSSYMPRNRLTRMRMRDGKRWTLIYRERAWDVAVEEARTRSFLSSLYVAVTMMMRQWFQGDGDQPSADSTMMTLVKDMRDKT